MFNTLYKEYLNDLEKGNIESSIYTNYLNDMAIEYKSRNSNSRIVLDYISLMTDAYFQNEYNNRQKSLQK